MEARVSPEKTNVVISYLNKPPPSKPLGHIGISYVIVERLGCSRTMNECEMCDSVCEKEFFLTLVTMLLSLPCACNWRILDRPSSIPGLWIERKGKKTKATCVGNWVYVLISSAKLARFRSLRVTIPHDFSPNI